MTTKQGKNSAQPDNLYVGDRRRARFSPARLKQALSAVMELGLPVGSIEFADNYSVRIIIGNQTNNNQPQSEFDLWEEKL